LSATGLLKQLYHRVARPPSTNYYLNQLGLNPYELLPPGGVVVDVGGGGTQGRYAFGSSAIAQRRLNLIVMDLFPSEGVAVLGNAESLPLRSESVDAVLSVSVLEYVRDAQRVIDEAFRVLKPGGLLYVSAPFVFPHHPPPEDRFRFSSSGLRALAEAFEPVKVGSNRGPASTFCHIFIHFLAVVGSFNSRTLYGVLLDFFGWCFFWIKYLDRFIGHYEVGSVLYGNAFFLGRKPAIDGVNAGQRS